MAKDMLDFQSALAELQMSEAELQNLIARGDLRAFRSGGTMKFRKSDIDGLRRERATEPTIIIPAGGSSGYNADVPQDLGVDESAATVVPEVTPGGAAPTVELDGGSGGMPRSGTEEILFEDSDLEILPLEDPEAAAAATVTAEEPVSYAEPESLAPPPRASRRSSRSSAAMPDAGGISQRRTQAAFSHEPASPLLTVCLVLTTIIFAFLGSVFGVVLWKGYYNETKRAMYVPSFLQGAQEFFKDVGNPK
jgi:hypothetical protein